MYGFKYGYGLIRTPKSGGGYTDRTTAFATATGITDVTILGALNTFDLGLISNNLDTKMNAVYPFVGGSAFNHKFNFMDSRDVDAAFRISFLGGWTHSSTGALPNGTNAYANTFLIPQSVLSNDSSHLSHYSRTNSSGSKVDFGVSSNNLDTYLIQPNSGGNAYIEVNQNASLYITYPETDTRGLILANRTASNLYNAWRNSTKKATGTTASATLGNPNPLVISAYSEVGVIKLFSDRECAFASIGSGLTDGEAVIFYNLIQAMQISLSRQV